MRVHDGGQKIPFLLKMIIKIDLLREWWISQEKYSKNDKFLLTLDHITIELYKWLDDYNNKIVIYKKLFWSSNWWRSVTLSTASTKILLVHPIKCTNKNGRYHKESSMKFNSIQGVLITVWFIPKKKSKKRNLEKKVEEREIKK